MVIEERHAVKDLTDDDIAKLEEIPEVVEAVRDYQSIQREYRAAALKILDEEGATRRGDVSKLVKTFSPRLKKQRAVVRELVTKNL